MNIVSTGIAGGGLVTIGGGTVTLLGNLMMTGGTVSGTGAGTLLLNSSLTTNGSGIAASITTSLNLGAGTRTFSIADGAALNDLNVTGVVSNGGIIKNGPGALRLGAANTYAGGTTLNDGTILIGHNAALGTGQLTGNGGTLQSDGAARTIANAVTGSFAVDGVFDLALSSPLHGDITKSGPGTLVFAQAGAITNSLTINAGTVRVDVPVTFSSGLTNSATLLLGTQTLTLNGAGLNNQGSLPLAGNVVAGPAMFSNNAGGTVSGHGTISAPFANSGGTLRVVGGTMNVTGAFANSGVIRLDGGEGLVGGAITNTGLIQGDGTIANPLTNAAGGELRADPGKSLTFTNGSVSTNAGQIRLLGGALDFQADLTNQAGAFVSGNGSLLTGGLTNHGTMNFAGTANLVGDVTNSATGKVISGGGGATIFYDDVTNNGEIRTSTNGFTVFFGDVTGGGTFTGTGTVNFEGDLSPGNSPAAVSFAGSVGFGPGASLEIELGGLTPGTQFDHLVIAGSASLAGILNVSLINDFTLSLGDSFEIADISGALNGTFFGLAEGATVGNFGGRDLLITYAGGDGNDVALFVPGLPGDFNFDGSVDVADYVLWRKTIGTQDAYNTWRANFGTTAGIGGGSVHEGGPSTGTSPFQSVVPEPAFASLSLMAAMCFLGVFRRSGAR
ncbi:MAG: autotransporter-associated beta strand repeat-containing protein [Planctomycetes bacterium]|nr:autotransporter-associated beta strand repeat-containing protein [Planctomycetota bacterium]